MATLTTARDRYLQDFEALEQQGALDRPSWLAPRRRSAMARFAGRDAKGKNSLDLLPQRRLHARDVR